MTKSFSIESEIANAGFRFANGRISRKDAKTKAKEVAPKFDFDNEVLAHKGINRYAKQLFKSMGYQK